MFWNQFGDIIDLDPHSSNFVDPDTINSDPHHYKNIYDVQCSEGKSRVQPIFFVFLQEIIFFKSEPKKVANL